MSLSPCPSPEPSRFNFDDDHDLLVQNNGRGRKRGISKKVLITFGISTLLLVVTSVAIGCAVTSSMVSRKFDQAMVNLTSELAARESRVDLEVAQIGEELADTQATMKEKFMLHGGDILGLAMSLSTGATRLAGLERRVSHLNKTSDEHVDSIQRINHVIDELQEDEKDYDAHFSCPYSHPTVINAGLDCCARNTTDVANCGANGTSPLTVSSPASCCPTSDRTTCAGNRTCVGRDRVCFAKSPFKMSHAEAETFCSKKFGYVQWRPTTGRELEEIAAKQNEADGNVQFWVDLHFRPGYEFRDCFSSHGGCCADSACNGRFIWGRGNDTAVYSHEQSGVRLQVQNDQGFFYYNADKKRVENVIPEAFQGLDTFEDLDWFFDEIHHDGLYEASDVRKHVVCAHLCSED